MAKRPRSSAAVPAATAEKPEVAQASGHGNAAGLVEAVRICYERELRLRRVSRKAKSATDTALLEAVRADVEYARLVRRVVPPTKDGAAIPSVRKQRQQVAARFRKRVERVTKRHASLNAEATRPLPDATSEANDTVMEDRKPLYVRESYYSHDVLPPDVARPLPEEDEDDDEPVGPDLGAFEEDDDDDLDDDDLDDE